MSALGIGAIIGVIAAFSRCFQRSRCLNIQTPCISCERSVLDVDNPVYLENQAQATSPLGSTSVNILPIRTRL